MSYVKHFAKTPILKLFFHHLNCRTYFPQKIVCQLLWSPLLCTNLLVQDVNPVTLGKPNAIYQQGSRNICKLIQNLTFFNTHLNENPNCRDLCDDSCFILIDHASSSFRLKLKTERGAPYNLVKTSTEQTEKSRKYHNFGIM